MKYFFTLIIFCVSILIGNSQEKTLIIDNQTPGWLSSKISYADQQSVENLTVTGYLNPEDMKFIGTLMESHFLKGLLDIENCQLINSRGEVITTMDDNPFDLKNSCSLQSYKMPKSLTSLYRCLQYLWVDTLEVGGESLPIIKQDAFSYKALTPVTYNGHVKHLILREGVEEIADKCFILTEAANNVSEDYTDLIKREEWVKSAYIESVKFPTTLTKIGKEAFLRCLNLRKINLNNNIQIIGDKAFAATAYQPDTLYLPENLTEYYVSSFYIKDGQTIYVPNINKIGFGTSSSNKGTYVDNNTHLTFYIKSVTKPYIINKPSEKCLASCSFYVPLGSYEDYIKPEINQSSGYNYNPFCFAKIIEFVPIEKIYFEEKIVEKYVGEKFKIDPIFQPSNATNQDLIWEITNNEFANIDQDGYINALNYGSTIIKAISKKESFWDTFTLNVFEHVSAINIPQEISIIVGENEKIEFEILPVKKTKQNLTWSSSNDNIVKIDQNGNILGLSQGTSTIKASSIEDNIFAECSVRVIQPVESVTLTPKNINLTVGESSTLNANVLPTNADDKTVTWLSDDNTVVKVDSNGKITGVAGGNTRVYAVSNFDNEIKDYCEINVYQPVTGIKLDNTNVEITEDGTMKLNATIIPENATNKKVNWSSSDSSVAIVSGDGVVYGLKEGQTTIIASSEDGAFIAICKISVVKGFVPVSHISLSHSSIEGHEEEEHFVSSTVLPENASNRVLLWNSSDNSIVSVDNIGNVRLIKEGTAVIYASATDNSGVKAECVVNVRKKADTIIPALSVEIDQQYLEIPIGKTIQLFVNVLPEETTDKSINWSSSDENIATVSENGEVKALNPGTTVITAICGDVSAGCTVNVIQSSGIEDILFNTPSNISIYSTEGILIKKDCKVEDLKTLNKGIYIIVSGKERYKIVI